MRLRPFFNEATPSATVAINERSNAMLADGKVVYKLGLGQSPFPVPAPVVASLARHAAEKDYLPVAGLAALREAVAGFHRRRDGLSATAEDIVVGPGSKELMFLLQLSCAGELLIPAPSWVSYEPQARIAGKTVRWIETSFEDSWRLRPEALDAAAAAAPPGSILVLNYPSNPTGVSYDSDTLVAIAEVARARDLILLSDEIYGEVHFHGRHRSIALDYPEGTIVSAGLSKWCGAGGWRLGTFAFPRELEDVRKAVTVAASETYTSVSAPIQHAAITAFEPNEAIEDYLKRSRAILEALARWSVTRLGEANVACAMPDGGFYLFPDFSSHATALNARGMRSSAELCERVLADTGVAFLPGSSFGRPEAELTARLAYVDFDGTAALDAASSETVDGAFIERYCPNVIAAITALTEWLAA